MQASELSAGITAELADFAATLQFEDLPSKVVEKTLIHMLDGVGCAAVGTLLPWILQVSDYARDTAKTGDAQVIGGPRLVPEWPHSSTRPPRTDSNWTIIIVARWRTPAVW
jgi:2-methylcitrate dehydratase PrpD